MKKTISTMALVTVLALGSVGAASAYKINGGTTDVGGLDDLLAWSYEHPPNDTKQIAWIDSILGSGYVIEGSFTKIENGDINFIQVDGELSIYAHWLTIMPSHYLIKTGQPYNQYSFLFENNPDYNWAVIDLAAMSAALGFEPQVINIGALSHISQVNPIPEPATMLLFGTGLAGLAGLALRRRKTEAANT